MLDVLTLDQLRILVMVSEAGSFSAAGRRLRRAQSAISQSIQTLEATQGVLLFDRSTKTPRLTEAGRVLVAQARQVLRQAETFSNLAKEIAGGLEPELRLAIVSFFPMGVMVDALKTLRQRFPDLPVTLYTEGIGVVERRLRDGSVELGILPLLPAAHPELQIYPVASIDLVPVAAASHPLAVHAGPIGRDLFADHVQLVLTDPLDSSGPSFSIVSSRLWRFVDLTTRLDFLLAGFGWANMPAHLVEPHLASGALKILDVDDSSLRGIKIPLFAVHARNRPPGKAGRWLLDDLQSRHPPHAPEMNPAIAMALRSPLR